jgi:hypothetical protein
VQAVCAALAAYPEDVAVQENGVSALSVLVLCPENVKTAVACAAALLVEKAMERHQGVEDIAKDGVAVLRSLDPDVRHSFSFAV